MNPRINGENGKIEVVSVKIGNGVDKSSDFLDKFYSSKDIMFVSESLEQINRDSYQAKGVLTFPNIAKMKCEIKFNSDGKSFTNPVISVKK
jgi:hypothetical protein